LGKLGPVGFDDPHALLKELSPALAGLSLRVSPDISRDGRGANYGGFEGVFVPSPRNHRWWVECRCLHSRRLQSKDARFGAQRRKKTAPTLLCVPDADKAEGETQADIARTYNVDPATISRLAAPSEALGAPPSGHAPRSNHPRCLFATLARVGNEI